VAEGIKIGDVLAVEHADFGVALAAKELAQRNSELHPTLREVGPGDEVMLVQQLRDVRLPVRDKQRHLRLS
jgi:hypothetical protein